jgi:ATP-binding cassette, subfamily B, bacterial
MTISMSPFIQPEAFPLRQLIRTRAVRRLGKLVAAVVGLAGTAAAGRVVLAVLIERAMDHQYRFEQVGLQSGVAVAGLVVVAVGGYALDVRILRYSERLLAVARMRVLQTLRALTPAQVRRHREVLYDRLVTEVDGLSCYVRWDGRAVPFAVAQVVLAAGAIAFYSWQVALATCAGMVPLVVVAQSAERRLAHARDAATEQDGKLAVVSRAVLLTAPASRAAQAGDRAQHRMAEALAERDAAAFRAVRASAVVSGLREFALGVAIALALASSVAQRLEPGRTAAVVVLALGLVSPALLIGTTLGDARRATSAARDLWHLEIEPEIADPGPRGILPPPGPVEVRFDDVSTAPEHGRLESVSLTVPPGRMAVFLGAPGVAQPAAADLITRLTDPVRGSVLLGGVPLTSVPFDALRRRVLALPRNGFVVNGSVADNIRLGRPRASDTEVRHACRELGLDPWIDDFPEGLNTRIGRDGYQLTGAEKQLVSLARAHLTDPDVLVVDDGHSCEPAMRERIDHALTVASRGRTTILVTRRPSSAKIADEVMVFDGGHLVETGTYASLSRDPDTAYARLHLRTDYGAA